VVSGAVAAAGAGAGAAPTAATPPPPDAAAAQQPTTSTLAWLRTLLLAPGALAGSWLPTMPADPLKMAQDVMGGRWCAARAHVVSIVWCSS